MNEAAEVLGGLDLDSNNAGVTGPVAPVADCPLEVWYDEGAPGC